MLFVIVGIWLLSIAIRFQCCLAAPLDEPVTNYVVGEDDIGVNEVLVLPDFQGPIFREDLYLLKNRDEKQSSKDEILKRSKRSPEPKPLFGLFRRGYYGGGYGYGYRSFGGGYGYGGYGRCFGCGGYGGYGYRGYGNGRLLRAGLVVGGAALAGGLIGGAIGRGK